MASPHTNLISVLLVEDSAVNQTLAKANLKALGITPDVANNGVEAIHLARQTPYDLILMDLHMPEMDGYEAVKGIRLLEKRHAKRAIIIAITASEEDREQCIEAGMDDYLSKPFEIGRLNDLLHRWLPKLYQKLGITERGHIMSNTSMQFDFEYLREISDGDSEFEKELVSTFIESAPEMISKLCEAESEAQIEDVVHFAHTLKGSSRSVGASEFSKLCEGIEHKAREGQIESGSAKKLETAFEALENEAQAFIAKAA